jgi:WD40 repeat protein
MVLSLVFSHDSTKLASASNDMTVRIWNAETGICKDVVLLDVIADALSFTPDERGIVTYHGVFALTGGSRLSTEPAMLLQPSGASSLASHDGTWVMTAGTDLLLLPAECRDGRVAVAGSTVAVGCLSGRVVLLGFSAVDIAVIAQLSVEFWWNFKSL